MKTNRGEFEEAADEFLKWTNGVDTEKWPPNIEG